MRAVWALALIALGCARGGELMPLERGISWTYRVSREFGSRVETVTVVSTEPVGRHLGWRLDGPSGTSKIAIAERTLWASELSGTRFDPPVPLGGQIEHKWAGVVQTPRGSVRAEGKLASKADKGQDLESVLSLTGPGLDLQVTTWTRPGIGIVRQDERSGGRRLSRSELVAGPTWPR
ncbi:MAG: hypothetical protein KF884_11215 [Fimbriimonadaceae bacterium]|nr:hypothetical protein [Fimbriimonadaceae bacterium]QYK58113.1 MAG: hypothetical protein KF884_11215 [Fimbriimonadaceae bacterium]